MIAPAYRLGLLIVLGTVLASAGLGLVPIGPRGAPTRAGQDLGNRPFELGDFRLIERSGRAITRADLADRVWIASFVFTRCPLSCPKITSIMKSLQGKLAGTHVQLVSLSVDPERDTPPVLADYARKFGADADRWWFLTGPKAAVHDLITQRFKLGLAETSAADQQAGAEAISHSDRLALVDRGKVVGFFDSSDPGAIETLLAQARQRDRPSWLRRLPAINATLNATCAILLVLGWTLIRAGSVRGHATCMTLGVAVSVLFLGCYVFYHVQVGSVPFRGVALVRPVYFTILRSHAMLATLGVVPLVTLTMTRALRGEFDRHVKIARVTFPIWLYVSITGVIIYLMLYQMPVGDTPFGP